MRYPDDRLGIELIFKDRRGDSPKSLGKFLSASIDSGCQICIVCALDAACGHFYRGGEAGDDDCFTMLTC
ncbi:MAG: hypothetical protein HRT36_02515 [Alphaproteobacteria bacterium]|nr:hypothetical protein [Alphaproteobacteria bacterium]